MSLRWKWRTPLCALFAAACAVDRAGLRQLAGTTHRPLRRANSHLARTDTAPGRRLRLPATTVAVRFRAAGRRHRWGHRRSSPRRCRPHRHRRALGLPTGNLQAPPAYPDAGLPPAPPPVITVPPTGPPVGPPPTAPIITTPSAAAPLAPPPTVDAQFAFPAPTIAQAGHPLVLTTIVTRRTDRAPLAGWTVRYEVIGPDRRTRLGRRQSRRGADRRDRPLEHRDQPHQRRRRRGAGERGRRRTAGS